MVKPSRTLNKPKRLIDEQSAAAAETVAKKPRRSSRSTATATAAAAETNDAPATTAMNGNYETFGEGENATVSAICILKGIDYHEAASGSALTEFNAERATELDDERDDAAIKYSLLSEDDDSDDTPLDLESLFPPPSKESFKAPEEKFHFFELCQAEDGKENKQRCLLGLEKMSGYVRSCIGFFGFSYNFAVYSEKEPGCGQWDIVCYCSTLRGAKKNFDNQGEALGAPGSLVHTVGNYRKLTNMEIGEIRDHRKDVHNHFIFRVKRLDVRTVNIAQIKKEAESNVDVWTAAQARLEMAKKFNGNSVSSGRKGNEHMFFRVTKEDDDDGTYGTRVVKSLSDLSYGPNGNRKGRGDIGTWLYKEPAEELKLSHLPTTKVGDTVRITTMKRPDRKRPPVIGTYVVTRISPEDYSNAMKLV
eukprot:scaffold219_cov119-Skeletonema_dohrnii-CCMP3373.AAC.8